MLCRKAGLTAQAIKWAIPTLIFLLASITMINFLTNRYTSVGVDTTAIHAQQIAWRGLDTLSYSDSHTRLVTPMVIEIEKLQKPDLLDESMQYPEPRYAARFSIGQDTVYFNRQLYERLLPLKGFEGPGGVRSYTYNYPITLKNGGEMLASLAQVEVLAVP